MRHPLSGVPLRDVGHTLALPLEPDAAGAHNPAELGIGRRRLQAPRQVVSAAASRRLDGGTHAGALAARAADGRLKHAGDQAPDVRLEAGGPVAFGAASTSTTTSNAGPLPN